MNSYQFEAEPRVTKNKSKYNPLHENPVQSEQVYISEERQKIKIENMHKQLINFKKVNKKMTPYDIKPLPNPSIPAKLDYFLTDPNNVGPKTSAVDCQTDKFRDKKEEPPFVPMKTGIDVHTQVEDGELFDFDREVQPIVNVITTKTLEQSLLEIEEEDEIQGMNHYKVQFDQRKSEEQTKFKNTLEQEQQRLAQKDDMLDLFREKEIMKQQAFKAVQVYNICRNYIGNIESNSLVSVFENNYYQNTFQNRLENEFVDWLVSRTHQKVDHLLDIQNKATQVLSEQKVIDQQIRLRDDKDQGFKEKQAWFDRRRINNKENKKRMVRVMYQNKENTVATHFAKNLGRFLNDSLKEYEQNYNEKMNRWQEQLENGDISEEEFKQLKEQEFPENIESNTAFYLSKVEKLGFGLAHNVKYDTDSNERFFSLKMKLYDENGQLVTTIDQSNYQDSGYECIDFMDQLKDNKKRFSDDQSFILDLSKLGMHIHKVLFYVETDNLLKLKEQQESAMMSRYQLTDFEYDYPYFQNYFGSQINWETAVLANPENADPEQPVIQQSYVAFSYLIQRHCVEEKHEAWLVQQLNNHHSTFVGKQKDELMGKRLTEFMSGVTNSQATNMSKSQIDEPPKSSNRGPQIDLLQIVKSKAYDLSEIDLNEDIESVKQRIIQIVEKQDNELFAQSNWGYEVIVRGKELTDVKQLVNARKLGDILFVRLPEPPKQEEEKQEENEDQDEEEEEDNDD